MSRTRKILDILDQLASSASLANDSANTSNNTSLLNTRKWLHDISVGRMPGGGPPRTTLRTPSRLYSIVTNIRDKPYWKRPTEMAAAAEKRREVSFEADTEPDDAEGASDKSTNNTELPKAHQPILKSYTGRNVAGSIKSNIFNTDIVDLEADISSTAETKKALESVKPPTEFGKNLQSGFLTKNRIFSFSKPVVRGPQSVEKSFEKGDSSSDESSMDDEDEESDKEVEIVSTKATNSDTSTSSPENSKLQKPPSPVTKQQTPTLFTNTANSWECPTCMVNNKASDDNCPCCQTPKAGITSATNNAAAASNAGPWDCSECWVSNKSTDDKCVACGTSKPGTTNNVATSNNAAPLQPVFKATEFKAVPTTVSFGFKPADTSAPKPDTTTNGTLNNSTNLFNVKPSEPAVAPVSSTPASFPVFGQQSTAVAKTEANSNSTSNIFSKPASANPLTNNSAAPVSGFKFGGTTEQSSANDNLFGLQSAGTAATFSLTAPKADVNAQTTSSLASAPFNPQQSLFGASKPAATVPSFNFGGTTDKPATNGTFQFNGTNSSSSNLFNLPINGSSAAPASSSTLFGSASTFSLGQQNSALSKTEADNNSTSNTFSNPTSGTPFTFNATAPVSGFNFGGTTDQPSTNGTFQFGGSNSSSNLFNLLPTGAAQPFSAPAPSFPVLGQQNVFMPVSGGGGGASSNNRKIILAKRQRKR